MFLFWMKGKEGTYISECRINVETVCYENPRLGLKGPKY